MLTDTGIDDGYTNRVREEVTSGTSALFVLTSGVVVDRVREALAGQDMHLLHTNLSQDEEQKLCQVFAEEPGASVPADSATSCSAPSPARGRADGCGPRTRRPGRGPWRRCWLRGSRTRLQGSSPLRRWGPWRERTSDMCRWPAHCGSPVTLEDLLFEPANSLVVQSRHARLGRRRPTGTASASAGTGTGRRRGCSAARSQPGTTATSMNGRCRPHPATSSRASWRPPARRCSRPTATRSATAAGRGRTTGSSGTS